MHNYADQLQEWVDQSRSTVFFGGAGVSTESGIPDFRSVDGLYHQQYRYPPEQMLSHTFYEQHPEEFFRFYRDKLMNEKAEPNQAHLKLAELEAAGKLDAVVTQNIDGLHERAGSRNVFTLHGSVARNYCEQCGAQYDEDFIRNSEDVPHCTRCGGRVKPDVVLYEEPLNPRIVQDAIEAIRKAELLIVGGTSLVVYPAAGLLNYFNGDHIVLINRDPTQQDRRADLIIRDNIGQVLAGIRV